MSKSHQRLTFPAASLSWLFWRGVRYPDAFSLAGDGLGAAHWYVDASVTPMQLGQHYDEVVYLTRLPDDMSGGQIHFFIVWRVFPRHIPEVHP